MYIVDCTSNNFSHILYIKICKSKVNHSQPTANYVHLQPTVNYLQPEAMRKDDFRVLTQFFSFFKSLIPVYLKEQNKSSLKYAHGTF